MPKPTYMEQRHADQKALDGIIDQTVDFAMTLREHGGYTHAPIDLACAAESEGLADRLGHGFDGPDLSDWERVCRLAYQERCATVKEAMKYPSLVARDRAARGLPA